MSKNSDYLIRVISAGHQISAKDTGYDPLIDHINEVAGSRIVKRVTNITQVSHKQMDKTITPELKKLIDQLK